MASFYWLSATESSTAAVIEEKVLPEQTKKPIRLRARVIVGSGSLSFEIIRYLTERLPVMICPRWLYTRAQPIAIRNVLDYLVAALDTPESTGRIIEIGGSDVLTYGDLLRGYARARGLKRWLVPVLTLRSIQLATPFSCRTSALARTSAFSVAMNFLPPSDGLKHNCLTDRIVAVHRVARLSIGVVGRPFRWF